MLQAQNILPVHRNSSRVLFISWEMLQALGSKGGRAGKIYDHIFCLSVFQEGCFEWLLFQNFSNFYIMAGFGCQIIADFVISHLGFLGCCRERRV